MSALLKGGSASATPGREGAGRILLAVLTGVSLYLCWRTISPFATVILWAIVLALMFRPLFRQLLARTRRPNLAASLTLSVAVVSVLLPLGALSVAVAAEVGTLADEAPGRWLEWSGDPALRARAAGWRADLAQRLPFLDQIDAERVRESLAELGESVVKRSLGLVGGALRAVIQFVMIVFSLFFLLRDGDRFEAALRGLLPLSRSQSDLLIGRTVEVIHASVLGVLVIAVLQGALGGVAFAFLGLPSPVLWGVVMGFFAMVPMVGAGAVWLPAALLLLATGQPGKAIALSAVGALLIGTIDNLLRPYLVGGRTGLHELVVFFAVLGGLKLFGVVGLLVGPAVFAVGWSLLELFRDGRVDAERFDGPLPEATLAPSPGDSA